MTLMIVAIFVFLQIIFGLILFFKYDLVPHVDNENVGNTKLSSSYPVGLGLSITCPMGSMTSLHCNDEGTQCQCCLSNGTSLTGEMTPEIKNCECFLRNHKPKGKRFGHFTASCEPDGTFSATQRHWSTGHLWCAHPYTGQKLTNPTRDSNITSCHCIVQRHLTGNRLGAFKPNCESDGSYSPIQNHPSTGMWWCADSQTGSNLTAHVRVEIQSCACPIERIESTKRTGFGRFAPKCDSDGSYSKVQIHASSGTWYCADPISGRKLTKPVKSGHPHNGSDVTTPACNCIVDRQTNKTDLQCDELGSYWPLQKEEGLNYCVDPETGSKVSEPRPEAPVHCNCFVQSFKSKEKSILGRFVPKCEENGTFAPLQLHASTGMTFCVDPQTGRNTTTPTRDQQAQCPTIIQNM